KRKEFDLSGSFFVKIVSKKNLSKYIERFFLIIIYYNLGILLARVSINLLIGPLIIIAIIGLNSPSKNNCISVLSSAISFNFAVNVKGNLLEAAPKTISEFGLADFLTNFISGIPFKPNSKQLSSITSNLAIFSGINFSKFLISVNASKRY